MEHVEVRELRARLSSYLDKVKQGGEIVVTEHGRPIARIVAVDAATDVQLKPIEAGITRPATAKRSLPKTTIKLRGNGPSIADYVLDQRR